jgi:hypothetical protein
VAHLEWPLISYYLFCRSQFACRVYVDVAVTTSLVAP